MHNYKKYIVVGLLLGASFVSAAPVTQYFTNIAPFTNSTYSNGTSTNRWLHISSDNASTTNLTISGINGSTQCLHVNASGVVSGVGSDCGTGSGGSSFGQSWEIINGYLTPTTTITTLHNQGFISNASSTAHGLSIFNSTTTNATTTSLAVNGTLTSAPLTSAILLTDEGGVFSEYAGTSCTNKFPRSLSALGAATCATVANTDLANSTISGISLGSNLADLTATNGTLTFSGAYNGGTARTVGLNLGSANLWTASTTFVGGFGAINSTTTNATTTSLSILNLTQASCDVKALTTGVIYCGTDATGGAGGGGSKWATSTDNTSIYPGGATKVGISTSTPVATLQVNGSFGCKATTTIISLTLTSEYCKYFVNAVAGNITITIPPATTTPYFDFWIKKVDSSANSMIATSTAGSRLDDEDSFTCDQKCSMHISNDPINAPTKWWQL